MSGFEVLFAALASSSAPALLAAAGGAVSAIGAIQQGNNADKAARYNAQVAENAAMTTRQQGVAREEQQRRHAQQVIGQQLAAGAESGTSLTGSNLDMLHESIFNSEMDALNIRYDRELNATGLGNQAAMNRWGGKQAKTAGYFNAAGAVLNGGAGYMKLGGKIPYYGASMPPASGGYATE